MGYSSQALRGFSWQTVLKLLSAGVIVVKMYFLARLLTPSEFGVFSLVLIALGISEATTETGVNVTIVQSKRSVAYFVDTAWVISIIRGLLIGSLMVLLGVFMTNLYQQPELIVLIGLASLVPVIKGFINPAVIGFLKNLEFFADSSYRFLLVVIDAATAVLVVWMLPSVVGLVLGLLIAACVEVGVSMLLFKPKPRFHYIRSCGSLILSNAKWLSFSALFNYLHENVDNVIVGKLTNNFQLGLYHNAYALGHKPNYDVAKSTIHGTFPIFTQLVDQPSRLLTAFLKSTGLTILLISAASMPIFFFPSFFVTHLLGEQWLAIVPLVPWLLLSGLLQSISSLCYNVLTAQKAYNIVNLHLAVSVGAMIVMLLILTPSEGLLGSSKAIFFSRLLTLPIIFWGIYSSFKSKALP